MQSSSIMPRLTNPNTMNKLASAIGDQKVVTCFVTNTGVCRGRVIKVKYVFGRRRIEIVYTIIQTPV